MNKKLQELYYKYLATEVAIRFELDKLECMECNCGDEEEIVLVHNDGHEVGVDTICGNCGGTIWRREL